MFSTSFWFAGVSLIKCGSVYSNLFLSQQVMFMAGVVSQEVSLKNIYIYISHIYNFLLFISAIAFDFNAHVFGYFELA